MRNALRQRIFLVAAFLLLAYGCGSDADTAVVDFLKRVAMKHPGGEPAPKSPIFRVAVGAIIALIETFVYYRPQQS